MHINPVSQDVIHIKFNVDKFFSLSLHMRSGHFMIINASLFSSISYQMRELMCSID